MALNVGELVAMVRADTRNFDRPIDQAGRRFGRFGQLVANGAARAGEMMRNLGARISRMTERYMPGLHSAVSRFRQGFQSADAAASALTGRMGTLGGVARRALDGPIRGLSAFRSGFAGAEVAASGWAGRMGQAGGLARRAVDGASSAARGMGSAFTAATAAASRGIARMREGMGGMAAQASGLVAAVGVTAFASSVVGAAASLDQSRRVLQGLYQDTELVNHTMGRLRQLGRESPINAQAFYSGAESLAYLGITGDQAVDVVENVGKAVVAVGGSSDNVERVTEALFSMDSAGRVTNETLERISSAGVPIFDALSTHIGVSREEVRALAADGKVSMDDVIHVLENGVGPAFANAFAASEAVTAGMTAQWGRFKDNVIMGLAEQLQPAIVAAAAQFSGLNDSLESGLARIPELMAQVSAAAEDWGLPDALANIAGHMRDIGGVVGPLLLGVLQGLGAAFGAVVLATSMFLDFISPLTDYLRENTGIMQGLGIAVGVLSGFFVAGKIAMMGLGIAATLLGPAIKTLGVIWRILSSTWMIGALKIAAGWLVAMSLSR